MQRGEAFREELELELELEVRDEWFSQAKPSTSHRVTANDRRRGEEGKRERGEERLGLRY